MSSRDWSSFPLRKLVVAGIISFLCLRRQAYFLVSPNISKLKNNARKIFKKSHFFGPEQADHRNGKNQSKSAKTGSLSIPTTSVL
jgi:hypothetical protein